MHTYTCVNEISRHHFTLGLKVAMGFGAEQALGRTNWQQTISLNLRNLEAHLITDDALNVEQIQKKLKKT